MKLEMKRRMDFRDVRGLTINTVIEYPCGPRGHVFNAVVIFTDNSWLGISAVSEGYQDSAYIDTNADYRAITAITEYLSATDLQDAGLIDDEEFEAIQIDHEQRKRLEKEQRIAHLRGEIEKLSGEGSRAPLSEAEDLKGSVNNG